MLITDKPQIESPKITVNIVTFKVSQFSGKTVVHQCFQIAITLYFE